MGISLSQVVLSFPCSKMLANNHLLRNQIVALVYFENMMAMLAAVLLLS